VSLTNISKRARDQIADHSHTNHHTITKIDKNTRF
jgi:hypothetical protein